jgi:glycosyltransferase involved in cell wall biosynthesis
MRFAIDAHAIGRHLTGNEVYVRNLLTSFAGLDSRSQFIAYLSDNVNGAASVVPASMVRRTVSSNAFVRLGRDLSRRLREDKPDLVHVQYTGPLNCPVPMVVSVHDISFLEHPEYFTLPRALQLRLTVEKTVRAAAKVITPSEFSRSCIIRRYGMDESKIVSIPIAVSSAFRPISRENARAFVKSRFELSRPYVMTIGDLQPRKNHEGLIRAFEQLLSAHPLPHDLVIVGQETWYSEHVKEAARKSRVADRIRFTGWVSDEELLQLYNACDMVVFPSFYEGFGLPILEAMACGRCVACSNTSAMPEVANATGLLFNPREPGEMMRAMRDVLLDPELRARMERLGLQRASHFTWETTARRTLDVYYEVAGEQRRTAARQPARRVTVPRT